MTTSVTDTTIGGNSRQENDVVKPATYISRSLSSEYSGLTAAASKDRTAELWKDEETTVSQYVHAKLSEWQIYHGAVTGSPPPSKEKFQRFAKKSFG